MALQLIIFILCVPVIDDGYINTLPLLNPCFLLLIQSTHIGLVSEQLNLECDILPNEDHTCAYNTDVEFYSCFLLKDCVSVVSLINVILY